jgi:hypothetical protein
MIRYEVIENPFGNTIKQDNEDGTTFFIPTDLANSDYQAYIKSLDEAATL